MATSTWLESRAWVRLGSHIRCTSTVTWGASAANRLMRWGARTGPTGGGTPSRTGGPAGDPAHGGAGRSDLIEDDLGAGQQLGARAGQGDPAGSAGKQRSAQFALQAPDQLAQRRSCHVQALGGAAEMKFG